MKSIKALGGGLGVAAMAVASFAAQAEGMGNFGSVSGNIGVASEYVFRGLPSSNNAAQVSGGLDWSKDQYYVGTWVSNVGNQTTGNEVDMYAGMNVGNFDVGVWTYLFPADPQGRNSKLMEVYAGYNQGMLSGYVWYGLGGYEASDDDYVYAEANVTGSLSEKAELSFHIGHTLYLGDDFNNTDDQTDLGFKLSVGGFWAGITTILSNDTNAATPNTRPRVNVGYSWTFDNVLDINLR